MYYCILNWSSPLKDFFFLQIYFGLKILTLVGFFRPGCNFSSRKHLHRWRRGAQLQCGWEGLRVKMHSCGVLLSLRLVQCPLFLCWFLLSMKTDHYPVCISLVHILKKTQSLTLQFSNKVWQSLFCKQVNFIM